MRFGEIALTQGGDSADGETSGSDTGRYLFITAEFDPESVSERRPWAGQGTLRCKVAP